MGRGESRGEGGGKTKVQFNWLEEQRAKIRGPSKTQDKVHGSKSSLILSSSFQYPWSFPQKIFLCSIFVSSQHSQISPIYRLRMNPSIISKNTDSSISNRNFRKRNKYHLNGSDFILCQYNFPSYIGHCACRDLILIFHSTLLYFQQSARPGKILRY